MNIHTSGLLDNLTFPKIFILSDQYRKPTHLLLRWQHGQQLLDALPVDDGGVHLHDGRPDDPRGRELCHADVDGVGPLVVQHDDLPVGGHRHLLAVLGEGGGVLAPGWRFNRKHLGEVLALKIARVFA